jgi:hypothetical protein
MFAENKDSFMEFIEVRRVITNRRSEQSVVKETINVKDIKTFRSWHKGKSDTFAGEATLIVFYGHPTKNDDARPADAGTSGDSDNNDDKLKLPTMLIAEDYTSFIDRMSARVVVKRA